MSSPRLDPSDLTPLPDIPAASPDDVAAAVERARVASEVWKRQRFEARAEAVRKAARAMLRDRATIIELVRKEVGKATADAIFTEALGPLDALETWVKLTRGPAEGEGVRLNPLSFPRKQASVRLVPRGVVGIIAPWNFPVAGLYRSVYPALLLGNAVVLKPSEYAPESSRWFISHLAAELPPDLAQVVLGAGDVGAALLNADIDACAFTGSADTGRKVQLPCAERDIPCSVELGGNDVAIVLADCALPRTIAGVTQWALQNAGQACGAIEVAAVEARIADAFVDGVASAFERLGSEDVAPLANAAQRTTVERHVADAVEKGAVLRTGGTPTGNGFGFAPTVLDHCTPEMEIVREETFGPVLPVVRVPSAYEGARLVNEGRFGLTASIWSADVERAERLADRLDVGVVTINNHAMTGALPELPWSGTRDSGLGIANSKYALTTFARPKALLVDRSEGPEPFWLPYDDALVELGHRLAEAQLGQLLNAWRIPLLLKRRTDRVKEFFRFRA